MNWLKRLFGGGTAVTVETEAERNLREASERIMRNLLTQEQYPCNGAWKYHSWRIKGESLYGKPILSDTCLRCGHSR